MPMASNAAASAQHSMVVARTAAELQFPRVMTFMEESPIAGEHGPATSTWDTQRDLAVFLVVAVAPIVLERRKAAARRQQEARRKARRRSAYHRMTVRQHCRLRGAKEGRAVMMQLRQPRARRPKGRCG
ncbi:hypothetical protein Tdes44962_MAKER02223 [Teratosphaeria destructans]|uniref:Uncharacterized protein n=1 Tax=Teratosphaeria destructans TaxID=418781 RepID=A0A9W7W3T5_9PEZI|nr:hypothetical protein Tdes44962_MAKER02223 [Teratosphaeria destructans]